MIEANNELDVPLARHAVGANSTEFVPRFGDLLKP